MAPAKRTANSDDDEESLRKQLGRDLYDEAKAKSRKITIKIFMPSKKPEAAQSTGGDASLTEPCCGTFMPRTPTAPHFRSSGDVLIPIDGTLMETETQISRLYNTKGMPEHARQLTLALLQVVDEQKLLAGYSSAVAACAVAGVAGSALGKPLLSKPAMEVLDVRPEAVVSANKTLRMEKDKLQPVLEQVEGAAPKGKGKGKGRVQWLAKPIPRPKKTWSAPGPSRMQETTATEDLTEQDRLEGEIAALQAQVDRQMRQFRGEKVGGRPRGSTRAASPSRGEVDDAVESEGDEDRGRQLGRSPRLPQRTSSRKRKSPDP